MTVGDYSVLISHTLLRRNCIDSDFADLKAYSRNEVEGMSYFILEAEIIRRFVSNQRGYVNFLTLQFSHHSPF